jgi:uncharacterized membrane protein YeaQ/YmgE (transglycosylase-associated protein family)
MMPFGGVCGCFSCVWVILVGGTAGYLVGLVVRGKGYNPIGNVLLGIVGFYLASFVVDFSGVSGFCGAVLMSFVAALVLVLAVRLLVNEDFAK